MAHILILDDEPPLLQTLSAALERAGHHCLLARTGREALDLIREQSLDLAILDIQLPDMSGLDVLRHLRSEVPEIPALIITAFSSVETAVEAMKDGAREYLEKPLDLEELLLIVERELKNASLRTEVEAWRRQKPAPPDDPLVGNSEAIRRIRAFLDQLADVPVADAGDLPTVLLEGETGTGKDLLARVIHDQGPLASKPFVQVNCAGLPRELVESELFGHEKGSFTSASGAKQGLFEVAQEGTIYLDEVGTMPIELQAKLLNVIEKKRVRRIGGTREREVKVRILAATNEVLEEAVADGKFRADLYYRLRVLQLKIPPLRERRDDIPLLAQHFLEVSAAKYRKPHLTLNDEHRAQLLAWSWPGNVRELEHTVEQMVLTERDGVLGRPFLPVASEDSLLHERDGNRVTLDLNAENCTLAEIERRLVAAMLELTGGNVSEAARRLGLSRGRMRHIMEKLDVRREQR